MIAKLQPAAPPLQPGESTQNKEQFFAGEYVHVRGLTSAVGLTLNGNSGKVLGEVDPSTRRYRVEMSVPARGTVHSIKEGNVFSKPHASPRPQEGSARLEEEAVDKRTPKDIRQVFDDHS
jgi:hypothetical protein